MSWEIRCPEISVKSMGKYTDIRIVPSTDGSHTLEVPSLKETYHSVHGAWTESMHVYIEQGLVQLPKEGIFRILDQFLGFSFCSLARQLNLFLESLGFLFSQFAFFFSLLLESLRLLGFNPCCLGL